MARFILRRFVIMVVMLALLSIVVFIILELPPGDYAERHVFRLRTLGIFVTEEELVAFRHQYGLDRPWPERYWVLILSTSPT